MSSTSSKNSGPAAPTKLEVAGVNGPGAGTDKLSPLGSYGGGKSSGSAVTAGKSSKIGKGGGSMGYNAGHDTE